MTNLSSLLLAILLVLPVVIQGQTTTSATGFYSTNGHYYRVITSTSPITSVSAGTSLANSQTLNGKQGYLATINDAGESSYIINFVASQVSTSTATSTAWIGAQKQGTQWLWFALNRVSNWFYDTKSGCGTNQYCNWAATPPASASCAQWYLPSTSGTTAGQWVGVDCSNTPTYTILVEFDASSSCDKGYTNVGGTCQPAAPTQAPTTTTPAPTQAPTTTTPAPTVPPTTTPAPTTPAPTTTASPVPKTFYIQSLLNGLVLDLVSTSPGSSLTMSAPSAKPTQQWSQTNGVFTNLGSGLVMDIKGADPSEDTPVIVWTAKDPSTGSTQNQQWKWDPATLFINSLISSTNPFVLDIYQVNTAQGASLCIWPPKTTNYLNQQWNLTAIVQPTQAPSTAAPTSAPAPSPASA